MTQLPEIVPDGAKFLPDKELVKVSASDRHWREALEALVVTVWDMARDGIAFTLEGTNQYRLLLMPLVIKSDQKRVKTVLYEFRQFLNDIDMNLERQARIKRQATDDEIHQLTQLVSKLETALEEAQKKQAHRGPIR